MRDDRLGDDFCSDMLYNSSSYGTCSQWSRRTRRGQGEAVEKTDLGSNPRSALYGSHGLQPVS